MKRHELLADVTGDRMKSCPAAAGENDSLHCREATERVGLHLLWSLRLASRDAQLLCGSRHVSRWLVAGSQRMLGQDLVHALGAGLCASEVTAIDRDSLDVTDLAAVLRQWPVLTFQHQTGQPIEL